MIHLKKIRRNRNARILQLKKHAENLLVVANKIDDQKLTIKDDVFIGKEDLIDAVQISEKILRCAYSISELNNLTQGCESD